VPIGPPSAAVAVPLTSTRPPGYREPPSSTLLRLAATHSDWIYDFDGRGYTATREGVIIRARNPLTLEDRLEEHLTRTRS
jgi:hypothetical protein